MIPPSPASIFPLGAILQVLSPRLPQVRAMYGPGDFAAGTFAVIFVIVAGVIVSALMRFCGWEGEPGPHQQATWLAKFPWPATPGLIVVVLFAPRAVPDLQERYYGDNEGRPAANFVRGLRDRMASFTSVDIAVPRHVPTLQMPAAAAMLPLRAGAESIIIDLSEPQSFTSI